jgi:hypothetical protein
MFLLRALVEKSEMIRNQAETHNRTKKVAVQGSPCAPTTQGKARRDDEQLNKKSQLLE